MNCAFEDCVVFDELLSEEMKKGSIDWTIFLKKFSEYRKPDADAIQDMAVENFIEMRDLVNDPFFKLKKECEAKIAKKYPDFITKYSLVSFSRVRYSIAKKRGMINDEVLNQLCKSITTSAQFDEE
jgi:kynurenine 3-monooxygenase